MEGGSVARVPSPGPLGRRFWKVVVLLLAVGALPAVVLSVLTYRESLPPREIEYLGSGSLTLPVPFMTLYMAGEPHSQRISSWTNFSFDSDTAWHFGWVLEDGSAEPVRFAFEGEDVSRPIRSFGEGPDGTLLYYPAGRKVDSHLSTTMGLSPLADPGIAGAYWNVSFTVRRVTAYRGFGEETWIQVGYSLHTDLQCGCSFAEMNVSWPSPGDLAPQEGPVTIEPGIHIGFASPALGFGPFRFAGAPFLIPAGRLGNLTAHLSSEFTWGPGSEYVLELTLLGDPVTLRSYVDLRFGSVYVEWSDAL